MLKPYSKAYDGTYLVDGSKNPSVTAEQYSKNFQESFDRAYVGGTLNAALVLATPYAGAKTVLGITGAMDVGAQYYLSDGFTKDSYKPVQTLFALASVGVTVKLGSN